MALKANISNEDFDKLDDALKPHYTANGDNYILDAEGVEDVTGLKAKRDELLAELKKQKTLAQQFEGLDAEEAKKALSELQKIEKEKLANKGQFDELLEKYKTDFEQQISDRDAQLTQLQSNLKREHLQNFLVKSGVKPDRAKFALIEVADQIDLDTSNGFELKLKGGIGDAKELEGLIDKIKTESPFLFEATNASGSGASGSNGNGQSSGKTWATLSSTEKSAAITEYGSREEALKAHN